MGPPSDVYSLGVVLFEWLAGKRPFEGTSVTNYLFLHAAEPAPPLASVVPDVPDALAVLVDRCLHKQAGARPSALELARGLAEVAEALGAPAAQTLVETVLTDREAAALSTALTAPGHRLAGV